MQEAFLPRGKESRDTALADLEELESHPGFLLLVQWLKAEAAQVSRSLLSQVELVQVYRAQGQVSALEKVLGATKDLRKQLREQ